MGEKVILGLSGGMDSAYVAIKLLEMGYDVTAVNIIMCDDCDGSESSRKLAEGLGIKFDVIDARRDFEELVTKPFVSSLTRFFFSAIFCTSLDLFKFRNSSINCACYCL